jgi:uncharacterized protein YfiM (DUF2279 family)
MSKKLLALMVSVLVLASAATAMAATKPATKTRKVGGTLYASISKLTGAKATITGFAQDKSLGTIAFVFKSAGIGKGVKTPVTIYNTTGSSSGTAVSNNTLNPNGTITIASGVFTVKSGAGSLKGSTGTIKFAGTETTGGQFTIKYTGSIKIKS